MFSQRGLGGGGCGGVLPAAPLQSIDAAFNQCHALIKRSGNSAAQGGITMATNDTQPTARRGRPEIGPKIEFRIPQTTFDKFNESLKNINTAASKLTTQTDHLRTVFEDGLNAAPVNTFDLNSRPDVDTVDQYLDHDSSCGIEVFSDGRTYWIASFETNDIIAQTTEPHLAAALIAGALIDYMRIMASDLRELEDGNEDGAAYPELVRAGFEILEDLPACARQLEAASSHLRKPWKP